MSTSIFSYSIANDWAQGDDLVPILSRILKPKTKCYSKEPEQQDGPILFATSNSTSILILKTLLVLLHSAAVAVVFTGIISQLAGHSHVPTAISLKSRLSVGRGCTEGSAPGCLGQFLERGTHFPTVQTRAWGVYKANHCDVYVSTCTSACVLKRAFTSLDTHRIHEFLGTRIT